ncbi:hypothetical protein HID58_094514 [Brassica napus]|uniref:Uncharacterized protein n=1 Tax=Brassica napus TaxID=3708 RepID=A0ABQ7X9E8_BRANA|nr:hypothetical protein HID58_094514 [Brassica napus]
MDTLCDTLLCFSADELQRRCSQSFSCGDQTDLFYLSGYLAESNAATPTSSSNAVKGLQRLASLP